MVTWVAENLGVGSVPMSYGQLDRLAEEGIGAIVNLCEEFPDLPEIQRERGFDVYYLPIADEEAPDLDELEKALAWLDEAIYLGKKVYIHCRHGIGRTGTVLNAYLLRRGLGHRGAASTLRKLRSKPESFDQWWSIRKYGRKAGRLHVRQPSLESKHKVDLGPFFQDYEELVVETESFLDEGVCRCGAGHDRCCTTPVMLPLVEAVYLGTRINRSLGSDQRLSLIERACEASRNERRAQDGLGETDYCLSGIGTVCPLSVEGRCMLFETRPLQCRTYELREDVSRALWDDVLEPGLGMLSAQVYFAYVSAFPEQALPKFALPDVISGRYVQTFFHWVMRQGNK